MALSRRRLFQYVALTGGCRKAGQAAQAAVDLDMLRHVTAAHGTNLSDDRLRVFQICDVLMLPAGNAAPKLEAEIVDTDAPRDPPMEPRPDSFNIANVTGIPAIVLPCGFTAGPPSLPLGIQFCAKPFEEATLFRIGHAYQSATDWHRRTPPLNA